MNAPLTAAMQAAADALRRWPSRTVRLFHHNDADGLSAGTLLSTAFCRLGLSVDRYCLEKPYPRVLDRIFSGNDGHVIVFADFAGRIAPLISHLNRQRNLVIICDHHVARATPDPLIHNLDPELYGLRGDRDVSAAATAYLFARELDAANTDLAHMAVIGAVGDGFMVNGRLAGENGSAAHDALAQGLIAPSAGHGPEDFILHTPRGGMALSELADMLDTLGGAGYHSGGPDMGVDLLTRGLLPEIRRRCDALRRSTAAAFTAEVERLKGGGLEKTPHLQWFHVADRFAPMGVKMIGVFCRHLKAADFIDADKYIVGIQDLPDDIPGLGAVVMGSVKISMRAPDRLETDILTGTAPGMDTFFPEATTRLGGFSDACHRLAAATTLPKGKEAALILEMEARLEGLSTSTPLP